MSKSINACYINVSMLFNLLSANITILLCFFFFFLVIFNNSFIIPVVRENTTVKEDLLSQQEFQPLLQEMQYSKYQKMQTKQ